MTVKPKEFFEYGKANYYILQKQENYIRQNTILILERKKELIIVWIGVQNVLFPLIAHVASYQNFLWLYFLF